MLLSDRLLCIIFSTGAYRGFSRDVTRSRACLVTPLIRHFGGQAQLCVPFHGLFIFLINLLVAWCGFGCYEKALISNTLP